MEKIKKYLISMLSTFLINIVLLLIFSAILTYTNISDNFLMTFVFTSIIISVLIGSFIMSRWMKEKGLIYGFSIGATYILIIYLINLGFLGGPIINSAILIYLATSCISGMLGGIMGVNI